MGKIKRAVFKRDNDLYYYEIKPDVYGKFFEFSIWENGKLKLKREFNTLNDAINYYIKNYD